MPLELPWLVGRMPVFDEEWGAAFTNQIREYIGALEASLDSEDDVFAADIQTLSGVPFCGCSDCYERETYLLAVKLTIEGYEAGEVRLE